jgi:hypothetical protein
MSVAAAPPMKKKPVKETRYNQAMRLWSVLSSQEDRLQPCPK